MEPSCLSPKRKHIVLSTKVDTLLWEKGQQQQQQQQQQHHQQHTQLDAIQLPQLFEGGSPFFFTQLAWLIPLQRSSL